MSDDKVTPDSPDSLQLRLRPSISARLNRKAVMMAIAVFSTLLGVVVMNVANGNRARAAATGASRQLEPAMGEAKELTRNIADVAAVPQIHEPPPPRPRPAARTQHLTLNKSDEAARLAETEIQRFPRVQHSEMPRAVEAWSQESTASQGSDAESDEAGAHDSSVPALQPEPVGEVPPDTNPGASEQSSSTSGTLGATGGLVRVAAHSEAPRDFNQQDEKAAFPRRAPADSFVFNNQPQPPRSAYELQTGTVIPATAISALNSDLPGEIIAQVTQNVYDSPTGRYLLIPQGSKLFGRYDSHITYGQGRIVVGWQRLIFPNGYTLSLDGMNGHDVTGAAGVSDIVDNHIFKIVGWGLLLSVMSAGAQLSQPQQSASLVPSSGQVAAGAVGQEMTHLGAQIAQRNLQVQPTLKVRKGYRMNVMVNRDIVFAGPYQP